MGFLLKISMLLISEQQCFGSHWGLLSNQSSIIFLGENLPLLRVAEELCYWFGTDKVSLSMAGEGGSSWPFFWQRGQNRSAPRPFPGLLSSVKIVLPFFTFPMLRAHWVSGSGNAAGFSITRSLWPELCPSRELPSSPHPAAHCCWWELSSCLFWGKGLGFATLWIF